MRRGRKLALTTLLSSVAPVGAESLVNAWGRAGKIALRLPTARVFWTSWYTRWEARKQKGISYEVRTVSARWVEL